MNSVAHVFGRRSYETTDTSRNSLLIALVTWRRGLAQQPPPLPVVGAPGLRWCEVDPTYYGLKAMSRVGIVKDMKRPPTRVLDLGRAGIGPVEDLPEAEAA